MSLLNQCSESGGRNTRYNEVDCMMGSIYKYIISIYKMF